MVIWGQCVVSAESAHCWDLKPQLPSLTLLSEMYVPLDKTIC